MRNATILGITILALVGCGGGSPPPAGQPAAVAPDGTKVPLPTEDGELQEGETTIEQKQPDGDEKKIEVKVDD